MDPCPMPLPGEVHAGAESGDGVGTEGDGGVEERHGRAGARVSAASGREGFVGAGTPPACCCVCMEPWTCDGEHRICCIPCGHVYGRSCLEMWLQRCGNTRAKCPQCGEGFDLKHITNLYAPGNMWDGCCHIQEGKEKMAQFEAKFMEEELPKLLDEFQFKVMNANRKLLFDLKEVRDHELAVRAKAFESMKEQMKKMAEQNAAPMDLIDFMEQSHTQLLNPSWPPGDYDRLQQMFQVDEPF